MEKDKITRAKFKEILSEYNYPEKAIDILWRALPYQTYVDEQGELYYLMHIPSLHKTCREKAGLFVADPDSWRIKL